MPRIMIVDDSLAIRLEVVKALKSHGFETVEAVDGLDAIEKFKTQGPIDLIIFDYNLPNMDGLAAAKIIGEMSNPKPYMLMLTTEANPILMQKGKEAGIVAWSVKPFRAQTLMGVISKLVNKPKA